MKSFKESSNICQHCQSDPCICDDSHGFVTETKRMSAAVKLQRAFEREQSKSAASRSRMATDKEQDAAFDKLKAHMSKPETMGVLKRLKNEAYNDYHNNRTGFAKRQREDDEYHTPDPTTRTHEIVHTVSKDGGEKHNRKVTISNSSKSPEEAKSMARAHLEKQGYTIHEEVVNEVNKHSILGRILRGHELKKKVDSSFEKIGGAQKKGVGGSKAFRDHERYANLERPGTWTKVKEEVEELDEAMSPAKQGIVAAGGGTPADKGAHAASQEKPPFDGPYKKKSSATPGKYGSGYSTARHLARQAMSKFSKPVKEESEYSRKAQIVKNAKKSKKTDDKFEPEPELGTSVVKADN